MPINATPTLARIPYAITVKQQANGQWLAQVIGWEDCQAEADSREGAIVQIQQNLHDRLTQMDIVFIDIPTPRTEDPWMKHAGMFKDDPLFDQVLEEIETHRRELDATRRDVQRVPGLHIEDWSI